MCARVCVCMLYMYVNMCVAACPVDSSYIAYPHTVTQIYTEEGRETKRERKSEEKRASKGESARERERARARQSERKTDTH